MSIGHTEISAAEYADAILDSTTEGIWTIGLDGLITTVNSSALRMFGYSQASEMIGQNSHELVHYKHADGTSYAQKGCPIYLAFQAGVPCHLEDEVLWRKDGSSFYADYRSVPLKKKNGDIIGAVVTFLDNTESRKMREDLLINQAWLNATLKGIGDAVIATDSSSPPKVTYINPICEKLSGWTLAEARAHLMTDVFKIVNEQTRMPASNPVTEVLREGKSVGLAKHTVLISRDGTEYAIEDSAAPIQGLDGSIQGVVLVFRDVTEEKRSREKNENRYRWLELAINELPFPIYMADLESGEYIFGNSAMEDIMGTRFPVGEKRLGQERAMIALDQTTGRPLNFDEFPSSRAARGEAVRDQRFIWRTFTGDYNVSVTATTVPAAFGNKGAIVLAVTDLTESVLKSRQLAESERLLSAAISVAKVGFFDWDIVSNDIVFSDQMKQDWGFGAGTTLEVVLERIHDDDRLATVEKIKHAIESRSPYKHEYRIVRPRGGSVWIEAQGFVTYGDDGTPLKFFGTSIDISERKAAESALAFERFQLETIIEKTPAAMAVWSGRDLIFERANPEYLKIAMNRKLVGKPLLEAMPELRGQGFDQILLDVLETGNTFSGTEVLAKIENQTTGAIEERYYDFSYIQIKDPAGVPYGVYDHAVDVTDRVQTKRDIEAAKIQAELANEAKSAFLANMSHEIRTPLGAIIGFSELLKDEKIDSNDRSAFVETVNRNAKSLTRIIDDILDLSKVEAGRMAVELSPVSLREMINDVLSLFSERARVTGVSVTAELSPQTPDWILSDSVRLRQILVNIVGNALKFTENGSVSIRVRSESEGFEQNRISIDVRDTGRGLSFEQQKKLFQPFAQADNSITREYGGTGLGLVLSKRLAEALGGTVMIAESAPNVGSTFRITFTAKSIDRVSAASLPVQLSQSPLKGINVLLIEDSKDNQFLIKRLLDRKGASVTIAENGAVGVESALKSNFDVVLMDIQMPVMDGYTAIAKLKAAQFKTPVIALTAHAMDEERDRTRQAGFRSHVTKPVDIEDLTSRIVEALETRTQ